MKGIIAIKNISDVITNSSSEVFMLQTDGVIKGIKNNIEKYHNEHMWYHNDFSELPDDIKQLLGGEDILNEAEKMLNESSGEGGEINIYDWEDAYNGYCKIYKKHSKSFTPEQWAKKFDIPLEELKKIIVVDVDWAAKVTISMLKERYNVVFEGDVYYESKYSDAFAYVSYANGENYL